MIFRRMAGLHLGIVLALAASPLAPRISLAQTSVPPVVVDPAAGVAPDGTADLEPGEGSGRKTDNAVTPLFAPIPFKNTQLGWGLMLMGGLIHHFDSSATSKPSTGAVGGFYTENGSWGLMAMEDARLARDRWRLRMMLSHMEIRYDFFGIGEDAGDVGRSVPLQQNMNVAVAVGLRRVAKGVYLGGSALYMGTSTALRDTAGLALPPLVTDTAYAQLFAPGLQGEVDTRTDDYWPTSGTLARLKAWYYVKALGGDRTFQRYLLFWSWYHQISGERLVLATNLNGCGAGGDAPFWALCSVGAGRGGLRGYTQGRYRDSVMTTVQAELRFHTRGRFGAVAFGGMGQVAPTLGDIFEAQVLPAGGLGVRYQLTQKYPMHLRLDYAWGTDGGLLYFAVAEAF